MMHLYTAQVFRLKAEEYQSVTAAFSYLWCPKFFDYAWFVPKNLPPSVYIAGLDTNYWRLPPAPTVGALGQTAGNLNARYIFSLYSLANPVAPTVGALGQTTGNIARYSFNYYRGVPVKRVGPDSKGKEIGIVFLKVLHIIQPLIDQ